MYIIDIILNPYALLWDGLHRSCFMPDLGLQLQRQSDGRMPSPAFVLVLGRRLQYYVNLRISMYIYLDVRWRDVRWCDVMWREVMWRHVTWRDVRWCEVRWHDVTWREVRWCDYVTTSYLLHTHTHTHTLHHTTMIDRWSRNKHIV